MAIAASTNQVKSGCETATVHSSDIPVEPVEEVATYRQLSKVMHSCSPDLNIHQKSAHEKAERAYTIVDAILYLVGGMESNHIWIIVQEAAPAALQSDAAKDFHQLD